MQPNILRYFLDNYDDKSGSQSVAAVDRSVMAAAAVYTTGPNRRRVHVEHHNYHDHEGSISSSSRICGGEEPEVANSTLDCLPVDLIGAVLRLLPLCDQLSSSS